MDTIGERIKHARVTAHSRKGSSTPVTQSELALEIGLTQGAVYKLESNKNKRGDVDVIKLMNAAEFLRSSFIWLATGRGAIDNNDSHLLEKLESSRGRPFYSPENFDNPDSEPEMRLNLPDKLTQKVTGNAFYTLVSDKGVMPRACSGDMVLVDPEADIQVGDFVLVRLPDRAIPAVRRIIERTTSDGKYGYTLQSLNEEFADRPLDRIEDIVGVIMEFRSFTRDEFSYNDSFHTTIRSRTPKV